MGELVEFNTYLLADLLTLHLSFLDFFFYYYFLLGLLFTIETSSPVVIKIQLCYYSQSCSNICEHLYAIPVMKFYKIKLSELNNYYG